MENGLIGLLGGMGLFAGLILLGCGVLAIFMAKGAFKGQKWTVILSLIFAALGFLSALAHTGNSGDLFGLVINGFTGYCAIRCLKSSYYK